MAASHPAATERDRVFAEHHEAMIARILKEHAAAKNPQAEILHLMELQCVRGAAGACTPVAVGTPEGDVGRLEISGLPRAGEAAR